VGIQARASVKKHQAGQGQDGAGDFTSLGYNLIGNTAGSSGWIGTDLFNVAPKFGPLHLSPQDRGRRPARAAGGPEAGAALVDR
jgi:hypothetical protein